uniref:Uncharacterized protein n=1 Tax=Anguilla anguilla TaxID=7936 RepID=A0A0E9RPQ3_ANGAN
MDSIVKSQHKSLTCQNMIKFSCFPQHLITVLGGK